MIPVMERDATLYEVLFYCLLFHYRGSYTHERVCMRSMNQKSGIIASSETGKFIDRLRKIYRNCSFYNLERENVERKKNFLDIGPIMN